MNAPAAADPLPSTLSPDDYSVPGNRRAEAFAAFAKPHLRGRVLDVGCGEAYVPLYLKGYPTASLVGVDPVRAPHPFPFWEREAERLTFRDRFFKTVVCATALDHVADPAAAVREIARVLAPDGRFLSWETIVPPGQDGPDEHHAFRFTEESLAALLEERFTRETREDYRQGMRPGCAECFSVWRPRVTA